MTTQHTPAPWMLCRNKKYSSGREQVRNNNGTHIAEVYSDVADDEVGNANARLIAAAPELLEALENAVKALQTMEGNMNSEEWKKYSGLIMDGIDKARPAIAKARG